ncbi:hypothetical protein MMG85_08805 [Pseudoxanthomonas sp. LH2527]|uniref:hypothetical protein n=1 Tax=Pseudoxanthomonas sp. LH2527 TaxID=2923249 RepID=UPI001F137503|nr:hypothetical protein [Pseudoxanthomonas sp. LH2527]MCH6483664.1 hypothetical protein [Pseudoxanthomonas sp. LH2527]
MRREQKQVFLLHLGSRQSIGPDDLRVIWATACESGDVHVSRRVQQSSVDGARPCYGLWVRRTFNRVAAEERLRAMLDARGYLFTLTPMPI